VRANLCRLRRKLASFGFKHNGLQPTPDFPKASSSSRRLPSPELNCRGLVKREPGSDLHRDSEQDHDELKLRSSLVVKLVRLLVNLGLVFVTSSVLSFINVFRS
jgi:hypothetical protein